MKRVLKFVWGADGGICTDIINRMLVYSHRVSYHYGMRSAALKRGVMHAA